MAKNFWEGDKPAGDDGAFWSSDRPAAQQDLPAGVTPSTAGGGRGTTGPSAYARPTPAPAPAPTAPPSDPMGSGDFAAAVADPDEERVSVLQDQPMAAPDPARRLSMGAGPISQETAARAERMVDGQNPGAANRPVVERAARGLQSQVDAGQRTTFGDLVERANDPTTQRMARDQTAEEFRSIGEWAVDSSTALASGAVSLVQMVPNIVAPDSALSATLAKAQQGLQDMESAPMQARRQQLAERVKGEDGFLDQYVATVSELVTNPSVAIQESLRQAAMFAGVLGAAKLGGAAAGGAVGAAERVSPTLALAEAISGGVIRGAAQAGGATAGGVAASSTMAAGDAAGATYEKLMATDDATWQRSPDFQELLAKGVAPDQAKQEIAVTKARLAALMAAPLGVLGFMGAEASFAGRAGAGAGRPLRTLGTEMVTEPAEEALTTMAGNAAVQTVNPEQDIMEGAGEAAGMATVTSAPFGGAAALNEMRARPPVDRSEQIKALRSAGDKTAADLLQRRQDREMTAFTMERETAALQPFGPAVQQRYRESRAAGAMPGDAVTQTAARTTFEEAAQASGLSEKARDAALAKAATMPADEAPGFLQRALQGFLNRGMAQPIEGVNALATTIETRRDELLDAVLAVDIRPTMDAITELEAGASDAKNAASVAAAPPAVAQNEVPVSREVETFGDNDILVAPETDAVHQAATSPLNDRPEPTQAQKEAGNYKLGRVRISGMDISVENPQGSVRRGTSSDGTTWETPMHDHYGYFRGTTAADGDKLDVFIKPGTAADFSGTVFVVDQVDPGTGKFDEAKVVFGATDQADAEAIYRRNYSANWQGLGAITALPMPAFKAWATSKETSKPLGTLPASPNAEVAPPQPTQREAAADQAAPAAGGDAASPAASVPATGDAGAVEADGVAPPAFASTMRKDGTLAVQGEPAAIRQRLAAAGITNVLPMRGGLLVGKSSAAKAQDTLSGKAAEPAKLSAREAQERGARERAAAKKEKKRAARASPPATGLRVGIAPGSTEPVTVRDGVVHIGDDPALDFDTGEPIQVAQDADAAALRKALKDGGAMSRSMKFFSGEQASVRSEDAPAFARAYHGTPHRGIERFSTDAIGTGEGAQAYGWGLYFASKQEVAEHYRKGLSYRETVREFREEMPDDADFDEVLDAAETMSPHRARVIRALAEEDWLGYDYPSQAITAAFRELDSFDVGQELKDAVKGAQGQLYQVQVPEDSELLLWDKPLSQQPATVRDALQRLAAAGTDKNSIFWRAVRDDRSGEVIYRGLSTERDGDQAASEGMLASGIKGIKYLDGSSRQAGEGSHNYVIFSGEDVAIEQTMYSRPLDADLFRRMTTPMQRGMPVADVEKAIAPVLQRWENGPTVTVVATPRDLPMDAPADAQGVYFQGQVHLVASNIRNPQQALRVLGHEAIAHHGLREMLGRDGFRQFTNQVQLALKTGNKALAAIQAEVRAAYVDENGNFNLNPAQEADEIAAKVAENAIDAEGNFRPGFGFVKAVYARIAEFLRGVGLSVRFTHSELQGMLVNAQRRLEAGKRTAGARTALAPVLARSEAPRISSAIVGANLGAATSHPKYSAAKGGDVEAAVEVARALVTADLVAQVRKVIGDRKPVVVPVVSIEASGRNKIPLASGELLAQRLGLPTTTDIVQANKPKRTAMDGLDRIFAVPEFDGPVVTGQDYLILDDTLTQGATFASLAAHIEAGGGRVVAAVALTGKQYSAKIQASADTLAALREKHGDIETDFRAATGYGFDALTESEARYLANFKPAESVRTRIAAERDRARQRQDQGDAGGLTDGPAFARDATLKSPAAVEAEASVDQPPAQGQPDALKPSFWDVPQDTRTDKFIYEVQDGRIDLKRVQQAIAKVGGQIREQFDARLAETLYPGRVAHRAQQFLEDEARPLLEVMARNNVPLAELSDYLHARGAEERNAQIAKVNSDLPDGGAGRNSKGVLLTNDAARAYLAAVTPARKMVLDALAKRVDAITAGTRKLLVDEGLEKAETIAAWEEAYKNYVPMFRDEAEEGRPHPTGSGMSVRGSASKRATGSTKAVTNILAHVLMQREAAITRAEKNRVAVALYGMALTNPNPDFWATIHPGMSPEAIGRDLQRMGVDPTVAEAGMQGVPTIRTVDPVLNRVVDRPNPIYKSMPGAIVLKVNGDDRVLMVDVRDPRGKRMAENLKNLDGLTGQSFAGTGIEMAANGVKKATRWIASVNTQYNPAFGLVNLTRDTLGGAINLSSTRLRGKTAKVLATTPAALWGIALELGGRKSGDWGKLFRQFQEDGGQTGYRELFKDANDRTKRLEAELKALEKSGKLTTQKVAGMLLGALDVFNTTLENAVRLAAYREALDANMSRAEAARLGRELTVDFNRKGRAGTIVGPYYAFFNAAVQGTSRTLQALAGPDGAKIIAGGLSLGVVQAVMLLLAGYDDDEIPDFVKARALVVPLGKDSEGKKQFFTIPYPLGLHVLPNTGRVLAELTLSGGKDAAQKGFEAVGEIVGALNPMGTGGLVVLKDNGEIAIVDSVVKTVSPTVTDPFAELSNNRNFAGAPIERESQGENDPRPGHQRVRESTLRTATGQTYTDIARIINTMTGGSDYEKGLASPTPERVRYLAQVVGGGLLREIEKTVNTSIDAAKGQPVKSSGIPVVGRFYGEVDDANTQRSRYFDNLREIETLERKIKAADKAGDVEAATRMENDGALVDAGRAARRAKKEISALNKEAMETLGDRDAMRAIDQERTEVMRDLNTEADEIRREKRGLTPGERLREAVGASR